MIARSVLAALVVAGALLVATTAPLRDQYCYASHADAHRMTSEQPTAVYACLDAAGWTHGR